MYIKSLLTTIDVCAYDIVIPQTCAGIATVNAGKCLSLDVQISIVETNCNPKGKTNLLISNR